MKKLFIKNCCDGIYNSVDVHFTSACDNKCAHCIDNRYQGTGICKPDVDAIAKTIIKNEDKYDDVLFLGREPCLYLEELIECVKRLRDYTYLKIFVTTAVPKICHDKPFLFYGLIDMLDGINLSVQHHDEGIADQIRGVESQYDRQAFYADLPFKKKIRINLNIVKPYLYTKEDIENCLAHYNKMGFNEIKLSEIQHGKDCFVSFEETFGVNLGSPYYKGYQTFVRVPGVKTPILLKRSCFMCEDTLSASIMDGVKACYKKIRPNKNNYGVVYEDGTLEKGWQ